MKDVNVGIFFSSVPVPLELPRDAELREEREAKVARTLICCALANASEPKDNSARPVLGDADVGRGRGEQIRAMSCKRKKIRRFGRLRRNCSRAINF